MDLQVQDVVLFFSQHGQPSEGYSIVHTGAVHAVHVPVPGQVHQQQELVKQLQQHINGHSPLSKPDLQALLLQV